MEEKLWNEIVLPNLITAFDTNPDSQYKMVNRKYEFSILGTYLQRNDKKDWNHETECDKSMEIDILIQLAKKTPIRIKNYCNKYSDFDIYPYKSNNLISAYFAFMIPVLISIRRQLNQLPINNMDIWIKIFSFCNEFINSEKDVQLAFNKVLNSIIHNDNGYPIVKFYSAAGGNFAKAARLTMFSLTAEEKLNTLKEWAVENPDGAAKKSLNHYFHDNT